MVRTQIQLTEAQAQELKSISKIENVSIAELIRRSVDYYLEKRCEPSWEERKKNAMDVIGKYASGFTDTSINHDKYLDEIYGDFGP